MKHPFLAGFACGLGLGAVLTAPLVAPVGIWLFERNNKKGWQ